jgi:hypothetical protein
MELLHQIRFHEHGSMYETAICRFLTGYGTFTVCNTIFTVLCTHNWELYNKA